MAAWTADELANVHLPWPLFHAKHPDRSYNSWEVKRRRVGKDALDPKSISDSRLAVPERKVIDVGDRHFRFGLVSDTHGGSKYEQITALNDFYERAVGVEGVDFFIHGGDITQGSDRMHLGMELEVHAHGADAQASYVAESYPVVNRDTFFIGGNHDLSFHKDGGQNIGRQIEDRRDDLHFIAQDAGHFDIGGLRAFVVHPDGAGSAIKTKALVEAMPIDRDPQLLIIGHYHRYNASQHRSVQILQLPCFQGRYGWLVRKGLVPQIGGMIVDVWLTSTGKVGQIGTKLISYDERLNDWDHTASEIVNRAADFEGIVLP